MTLYWSNLTKTKILKLNIQLFLDRSRYFINTDGHARSVRPKGIFKRSND